MAEEMGSAMTLPRDARDMLTWSAWQALESCWLGQRIPASPGLYRVCRTGRSDLDYIGQTGSGQITLRQRLGMLRGVYADQMPYRDPHTAAPALWALRHSTGCTFDVSVAVIDQPTPLRKGLECVAISMYRQECGHSPTIQFGRMPTGYRMPSSNNARIARAGKRFRGGPTPRQEPSHLPSLSPVGPLLGDPQGRHWCGHGWSTWTPVREALQQLSRASIGLYRIRSPARPGLLYIGQGKIQNRLVAHMAKVNTPHSRQGPIFSGPLECSWVVDATWRAHERLELENDLIAAYVLATREVPPAQFLG